MTRGTDDATDREWTAAAERMLRDLQQRAGTADRELRDATESMQHMTPRQRAIAVMLPCEHDQLHRMLASGCRGTLAWAVVDLLDVVPQEQIEQTAERLADRMLAEIRLESAAYRSHARLRLMRLHSCISGLRDREPGQVERQQLLTLATELLHLCEHLGIARQPAAGQGVPHE